MSAEPLKSLRGYSDFIATALEQSPIKKSTLMVWSTSPYTGLVEGEVFFDRGYRLRMREEPDFDAGIITSTRQVSALITQTCRSYSKKSKPK